VHSSAIVCKAAQGDHAREDPSERVVKTRARTADLLV